MAVGSERSNRAQLAPSEADFGPAGLASGGSATTPTVQSTGPSFVAGWLEWALVAAVTCAALLVRWPELLTVPRFTDEMYEVGLAAHILEDGARPLTSQMPHIGPLYHYLVAVVLGLFGPRLEAGRMVAMLLGALTVVPTYLLGRSIGGPIVGLLAALLLATSASHIVVNSHVAYSHAIMPLFSTAGLWLLQRAVSARSGPYLVASGLAFGLAFQVHPSVLALGPGLALYFIWRSRLWASRWLLLAGVVALLSVANLLMHNARTGFSGADEALDRSEEYRSGRPLSLESWMSGLLVLLRTGAASLGGLVSETAEPQALLHPLVAVYAALAVLGLLLLCRRGEWLPALAMLSGLLLISLLNGRLEPVVVRARHYALLLPLGYVAVAVALVWLRRLARRAAGRRWIGDAFGLAALLILLAAPLGMLFDYYSWAHREQRTNQPLLAALEAVALDGELDQRVYLDRELRQTKTLSGGTLLTSLGKSFEVRDQRFAEVDLRTGKLPIDDQRDDAVAPRVVVHPRNVDLLARHYRLTPAPGEPGPGAPLRVFQARARG